MSEFRHGEQVWLVLSTGERLAAFARESISDESSCFAPIPGHLDEWPAQWIHCEDDDDRTPSDYYVYAQADISRTWHAGDVTFTVEPMDAEPYDRGRSVLFTDSPTAWGFPDDQCDDGDVVVMIDGHCVGSIGGMDEVSEAVQLMEMANWLAISARTHRDPPTTVLERSTRDQVIVHLAPTEPITISVHYRDNITPPVTCRVYPDKSVSVITQTRDGFVWIPGEHRFWVAMEPDDDMVPRLAVWHRYSTSSEEPGAVPPTFVEVCHQNDYDMTASAIQRWMAKMNPDARRFAVWHRGDDLDHGCQYVKVGTDWYSRPMRSGQEG